MLNNFSSILSKCNAKSVERGHESIAFNWKFNQQPYRVVITTTDYNHISISHNNPKKKPKMDAVLALVDICFVNASRIDLNTKGAGLRPNVYHIMERHPKPNFSFRMKVPK